MHPLEVNTAAEAMYGYTRDELLQRRNIDLSAEPEKTIQGVRERRTRIPIRFHRKKDGTVFPVEIASRHFIWHGRPVHIASRRDITERLQAEVALKESEARYRQLFERINTCVAVYRAFNDGEDFVIEDFNSAAERTERIRRQEILGRKVTDVFLGIKQFGLFDVLGRVWKTGISENHPDSLYKDERMIGWRENFVYKLPSGEIVAVYNDVTERKQAEDALRESEEKFRGIMENIGIGVVLIGSDMKIVEMNRQMRTWFPHIKIEERPICYYALNDPPREGMCDNCPAIKTLKDGKVHEATRRTPQAGGLREYRVVSSPVHDKNGRVVAAIEMVEDITERRALEERLQRTQKIEAIGTLAGGIAHDFNNILTPLIVHNELAMISIPDGHPVRSNLEATLEAAERAKTLVKQILTFSRQNKQDRMPLKIDLIIKEILNLIRSSLPSTIEIRWDMANDLEAILADPGQIHQMVMNLCTNAAHAMRERGGILEVGLTNVEVGRQNAECGVLNAKYGGGNGDFQGEESRSETRNPKSKIQNPKFEIDLPQGRCILLSVSDTGDGIDPFIMDKIFNPYFTTKGVGEGTGMGLAVVHGIVKGHGGGITVESEPGKGTTFKIYLPALQGIAIIEERPQKGMPRGSEHILLVDDEKSMVNTMVSMLEHLGYRVTPRTSSIEALEAFRANPDRFDLVITDQTMPNMTGGELAARLLGIKEDMPIILCTGFSELIDEQRARKIGIREFVMKPIVMGEMARSIRKALKIVQ